MGIFLFIYPNTLGIACTQGRNYNLFKPGIKLITKSIFKRPTIIVRLKYFNILTYSLRNHCFICKFFPLQRFVDAFDCSSNILDVKVHIYGP